MPSIGREVEGGVPDALIFYNEKLVNPEKLQFYWENSQKTTITNKSP